MFGSILKRLTSAIVGMAMVLVAAVPVAFADEPSTPVTVNVSVNCQDAEAQTMRLRDNRLFADLSWIAQVTRFSSTRDGSSIVLKHAGGVLTMFVDLDKQTIGMSLNGEKDGPKEESPITVFEQDGVVYVPAYETLTYMGATVDLDDSKTIMQVDVPLQTFWESYAFVFEQKMAPDQVDHKDVRQFLNNVIDFVNPGGKNIAELMTGAWVEDAIIAAMGINVLQDHKIDEKMSEWVDKQSELAERASGTSDAMSSGIDLALLLEDERINRIVIGESAEDGVSRFISSLDDASFKDKVEKANKVAGNVMDVGLLAWNSWITINDRVHANMTAVEALKGTFSQKTLSVSGNLKVNDDYKKAVDKAVENLKNPVSSAIIDNALTTLIDKIQNGIINPSTLTSFCYALGGLVANVTAASPVGKYTPFAEIPKAEYNRTAIVASDYYQQVWNVWAGLIEAVIKEHGHNQDTLKRLYQAHLLMLRFSIVWADSMKDYSAYVAKGEKAQKWFEQRGNDVAGALYDMENSVVKAIPVFSDLHDAGSDLDRQLTGTGSASSSNHRYAFYEEPTVTDWGQAKAYCTRIGGHLATISSQQENDHVFGLMKDKGYQSAYFGFQKSADGTWIWSNGEASSYTNWHEGEPNDENSSESYGEFYWKFTDGTWNDGNFDATTVDDSKVFICEWDSGGEDDESSSSQGATPEDPSTGQTQSGTRLCPFPTPLNAAQLAKAGASCAWGYEEYCDCA